MWAGKPAPRLPAPLHAILATLGTDGDVFPYLGLGAALRRRGHAATLVTIDRYRAAAERLGLGFASAMSDADAEAVFNHPDFWHPIKGPRIAAAWGTARIPEQYALLERLAGGPGRSVLVANPGVLAARLLRERAGVPLASVMLQPWMVPSLIHPPVLPGPRLPPGTPRVVHRAYFWLLDVVGDLLVGRAVNRFRQRLGLRPVRRVLRWWLSPDLIVGLFPDWYGLPQADWPGQIRLAGFARYDGPAGGGRAARAAGDWAAFCAAGDPPVAFTQGTGVRHAAAFFAAAADACRQTGRRGLLLTPFPEQLPPALPPGVRACGYAPFRELLPRCAAFVHHGGVGTVAAALQAGVPQLVVPLAYDQPDNGQRLAALGVGAVLPRPAADGPGLARAIAALLTPDRRAACEAARARLAAEPDGLDVAAGMVEGLAGAGT